MKRLSIFIIPLMILILACGLTPGKVAPATPLPPILPTTFEQATQVPANTPETEPAVLGTDIPISTLTPVLIPDPTAGGSILINPDPPDKTVKLIFIHHSSGENWLADDNGGLGLALMKNNYFVSDTNYDWGPNDPNLGGPIGSYTDFGNWWNWFLGPNQNVVLKALYSENQQHAAYTRLENDPGGENEIILFKSCFPNSGLNGNPDDAANTDENPLNGQDASSENHTIANAKGIYINLLKYFGSQPDHLFIAVTAPPLLKNQTSSEQAENIRSFNHWLVNDWLKSYPNHNVAVFDFFNVLTTNGGSPEKNDLNVSGGNHHRYINGGIEYVSDQGGNTSAYALDDDSHPQVAGNQKAAAEFLPLLNIYYHRWQER